MVCYVIWIDPSFIDPSICTHIVYGLLGFNSTGALTYSISRAQVEDDLRVLVGLKSKNPNLQILASVSGWNNPLDLIFTNKDIRENCVQNIVLFMKRNNLNGIDIDWEFPSPPNVGHFTSLLKNIKQAIGNDYSLSCTISADTGLIEKSYDISEVFKYSDFVNLMAYDYHGRGDVKTGFNAPLYSGPNDRSNANVNYTISFLLNKGVPRNKVILGMPANGIEFFLDDPKDNRVGSAASYNSYPVYSEICLRVKSGELSYVWDDIQKVPYAFKGSEWISYDDVKSIKEKSNYIIQQNLGGGMFWNIEDDDYGNNCGGGNFPLISTAFRIVVGVKFDCPSQFGLHKHSTDCTRFYYCVHGTPYIMNCPSGLLFNNNISVCDWPSNVVC